MKPALAFRQPQAPKTWSELPSGNVIKTSIEECLLPWWPRMFGYYLLQIGALAGEISVKDSLIKNVINASRNRETADIVADIDDLPFIEHGVDVCLLNHCLEFSVDPHHVVREANRVLIPNGYLIISGYNPLSLAGLNKLYPYRRKKVPWQERFFTPARVKDWLHLMGYEILEDSRFLHSPLVSDKESGFIGKHWQKFASNYLNAVGSVYLIIAKKRLLPLTPIKPKWKVRPNFEPVKVSTMQNLTKHK